MKPDLPHPLPAPHRHDVWLQGLRLQGQGRQQVLRCLSLLSAHSLQCAENTKFLVRASYLEIYNEDVRDLLGADTKQKLEVGADLA